MPTSAGAIGGDIMRLTFVGTGVSCAIPVIGHLTTNCACRDAICHPDGPNRRNNVSLLISLLFSKAAEREEEEWHHILVDCGKTFRNAYMRVLAPMRVQYVDALLVTHGHADAMHCVEELCAMQAEAAVRFQLQASANSSPSLQGRDPTSKGDAIKSLMPRSLRRIPTFLTPPTLEQIGMISPDLVKSSTLVGAAPATRDLYACALAEKAEPDDLSRASTVMDVFFMNELLPQRMYVPLGPLDHDDKVESRNGEECKDGEDIPFYSFPVEHGKGYISMAWVFGRGTSFKSHPSASPEAPHGSCVVYISDVSDIPAVSMAFLQDLVRIDVLILDLLAEHGAPSASHYCADEALPLVKMLMPSRTYFVGMFCSLEHHSTNVMLAQELTDMKAKCLQELEMEMHAAQVTLGSSRDGSAVVAKAEERERMRRFLTSVRSVELAYDGQQIEIPA